MKVKIMDYQKGKILKVLIEYFNDDYRRIDHALQVLHYSENIMLKMNAYDREVVIAVALLHDIGIKVSEEKLGYNNGKTQEEYGPNIAEELLRKTDFPVRKIKKVKEIIGNHHSPDRYDYIELKILKEADKIVNSYDK